MRHHRMVRHLVIPAAAATVLLGTLLSPPAAMAAAPAPASARVLTPAPAPASASEIAARDCAALQLRAAALLTAGQNGNVACLESHGTGRQSTGGVGINASCPRNSDLLTRSTACSNSDWRLNIRQIPSGAIVGWIDFSTEILNTLSYRSLIWTQRFVYTPRSAFGAPAPYVVETLVQASPTCIAACEVASLNPFLPSPAMPPVVVSGTASFLTGGSAKWSAGSGWRFQFTNPNWLFPQSNAVVVSPPLHRCDQLIGGKPAGCAYPSAEARHNIPSLRYPKYARHVSLALAYGLDRTLTRTTDPAIMDANRRVACGGREGTDGWSCDEYPYASTLQGAASQPYGRTFLIANWNSPDPPFICNINHHLDGVPIRQGNEHDGYSVCMIPLSENTGGGSDLVLFFYENRVINGDNFTVYVV